MTANIRLFQCRPSIPHQRNDRQFLILLFIFIFLFLSAFPSSFSFFLWMPFLRFFFSDFHSFSTSPPLFSFFFFRIFIFFQTLFPISPPFCKSFSLSFFSDFHHFPTFQSYFYTLLWIFLPPSYQAFFFFLTSLIMFSSFLWIPFPSLYFWIFIHLPFFTPLSPCKSLFPLLSGPSFSFNLPTPTPTQFLSPPSWEFLFPPLLSGSSFPFNVFFLLSFPPFFHPPLLSRTPSLSISRCGNLSFNICLA